MRIVFFGTSTFASGVLKHLLGSGHTIVGVVTRPDKPQGRSKKLIPSPVKNICPEIIPLYQPVKASTDEFAQTLKDHKPDLFLVVAYGEIIKANLLSVPTKGSINIHPSLLPKYRGASPIQAALINGDKETGVSIIEMVLKMDAGDLLAQETCLIGPNFTFPHLEEKLLCLTNSMLDKLLPQIDTRVEKKHGQDDAKATYVEKIDAKKCRIDWNKSAVEVHNLVRALTPKPGAWTMLGGKRLKILESRSIDKTGTPGELIVDKVEGCSICCEEGALQILILQLEGKSVMEAKVFANGRYGTYQL